MFTTFFSRETAGKELQ